MELLSKANEFRDFLYSLTASKIHASNANDRLHVYNDEYTVTVLPSSTVTPFTDFTGHLEGPTVIVSKYDPSIPSNNELGLSPLKLLPSPQGDTLVHEDSELSEPQVQVEDKFPCFPYQAVNVGQPLSQKRVFLTQSSLLHSGHTEHLVTEQAKAYDTGVTPLSLDQARYLSSLYALSARNAKTQLPNLWMICKDEKRDIVALGSSHCVTSNRGKGFLQTFVVTAEDIPAESQSASAERNSIKCKGKSSLSGCDNTAFSEYEIAKYSVTEGSCGEEKLSGDLTVQFTWNGPDNLLSPPPQSADAVVKLSATPGYLFSPGLSSYNELNILLHLCNIAAGKSSWSSESDRLDEESITVPSSAEALSEKVGSFLEDVSSPLSQRSELTVISPTSENQVYEPRKDLDFAERLWLFAKDATSLEDLQRIFAEVFKAVLLGRVQPFVHRSSTSVLSSLLRKVLLTPNMDEKQDLAPKFQNLLTESKICMCLVQLGIEKVMRDYRGFFIGSDIATGDQLDQFFSAAQGSQLERCHALCKLHCILELMSSALSFLKLPPPALSALFKMALEVYRESTFEGFTTTPVFSLPLPAYSTPLKSLASFCSSLTPKKWILSQQIPSSNAGSNRKKTSLTLYKNQPLLENLKDKDLDEGRYYVYKGYSECI